MQFMRMMKRKLCLVSKYIINLLKKYRNECLFIFTYNMDNPGFSYQILPEIEKYVVLVMLVIRELDDDQAVVAMVDSNLHRENLKPSEKAFAYKMKLMHELSAIGNNINQIARMANTNVFISKSDVQEVKEQLQQIQRLLMQYIRSK